MKLNKYISLLLVLLFSFSTTTFAHNGPSTEFFLSNNTSEIDLQTAFNRLHNKEQQKLQNDTINILQEEHVEQSKFEDLLGTYKMADQNITADNSEKIITSTYQTLPPEKVFNIAKRLAILFDQESVAVFIPNEKQPVGNIILKLKSHSYTISETIQLIQNTLPSYYSQAFSLHLSNNTCPNFNNALVDEVEWLGSKIKPTDIAKAFPQEQMIPHYGKAYLIYKNGEKDSL